MIGLGARPLGFSFQILPIVNAQSYELQPLWLASICDEKLDPLGGAIDSSHVFLRAAGSARGRSVSFPASLASFAY